MADDSPDPAFRKAAAAYQSAGNLRRPPATPQLVRMVEPPAALPVPVSANNAANNAPAAMSPPAPSPAAPVSASPSGGVSLMITTAQKEDLRRLGLSEAEIRDMTPAEAHRRLGLSQR